MRPRPITVLEHQPKIYDAHHDWHQSFQADEGWSFLGAIEGVVAADHEVNNGNDTHGDNHSHHWRQGADWFGQWQTQLNEWSLAQVLAAGEVGVERRGNKREDG